MKTINPCYKLIGILIPIIILAFLYSSVLNFAVFAASMIVLVISKVNWRTALRILLPVLLIAIGMYVTGTTFYAGSNIGVGGHLSNVAIENGIFLASRVLAFAGLGALFVLTTNTIEFIRSLEQQLHIPVKFVYGLLAAFQLLPNLQNEYRKTKAAFWARGLYPIPVSPKLLIPLMVKAVRWSEALAAAMESKGFDGAEKRTIYKPFRMRKVDYAFPFMMTSIIIISSVLMPA